MVNSKIGDAVARLLLGGRLRTLRESRGVHSEYAATQSGVARATLWRMERGDSRCRFKARDVEILTRLYGEDDQAIEAMVNLTKATRDRSWAADYRELLTPVQETYFGLEECATRIRCYAYALMPELLQTEGYFRALLQAQQLLRTYDAAKHTRIRMRRQEVLVRDSQPARFEFLLNETVLQPVVGGPSVMAMQLRALIDRTRLANVSVRVVPHQAGMYASLGVGPFTLLDFATDQPLGGLPTTVYMNQLGEDELLNRSADVGRYEKYWNDACACALDARDSEQLITEALGRIPAI